MNRDQLKKEALGRGNNLGQFARMLGAKVATEMLSKVAKSRANCRVYEEAGAAEMSPKATADDLLLTYHMTVEAFIVSLLETVRKTDELVTATGLLDEEGIPWREQGFDLGEILAEAERVVSEAEQQRQQQQGK
jgi:hypothetical protein